VAILSFKDMDSEALWNSASVRAFVNIQKVAMRKLVMLDAAGRLEDLRIPPGNRLEALAGDRAGQHSIRINEQFRVCFVWTSNGPKDVEICDYH
jgi:proteic killer suppression protein